MLPLTTYWGSLMILPNCDMTHLCVTWLLHMWHDPFICDMTPAYVTWLLQMWHEGFIWDMTPSYVTWPLHMWHDPFICDMTPAYVTWPLHMWHDSCIYDMTSSDVTWLLHMRHDPLICDMTPSYVTWLLHTWHDPLICDMTSSDVTWLLQMWRDFFIYEMTSSDMTWLLQTWHDSFILLGRRDVLQKCLMWYDPFLRDMTHSCETWLVHVNTYIHTRHIGESKVALHRYLEGGRDVLQKCVHHVTWPILTWHDSCIRDTTYSMGRDSFTWDMTHSYKKKCSDYMYWEVMDESCLMWRSHAHWMRRIERQDLHMRHDESMPKNAYALDLSGSLKLPLTRYP